MTVRRVLLGLVALVALIVGWNVYQGHCWSAWFRYGADLDVCPTGRLIPGVAIEVYGLRRGSPGRVHVVAHATFVTGRSHDPDNVPLQRGDATLALVTRTATIAITPDEGWSRNADGRLVGRVALPKDLPDGDHTLVATVNTALGPAVGRLPLPVYAPAKVLVMTDRPLYEAGNGVQFRAVVLRARDMAPLDERPGQWWIEDPSGQQVYAERAAAGAYGVVAGDFPLGADAPTGTWTVGWRSGQDAGKVTFRVEPFELPRFTVEAQSARPHYGRREAPVVRGTVRYASGAPVAAAQIQIEWAAAGVWPPPSGWLEDILPRRATADDAGRFTVELPRVPADLAGQVRLQGRLTVTDSAGDQIFGSVGVLLSEDPIQVAAVTELADGLVEGFNNRLYLRATSAAGRVLRNTTLKVTRAWDPTDPGQTVTTDVDGVAALQIDPGPAVTVVEPGLPIRPPRPPPPVVRIRLQDHLRANGPTLKDQARFDRTLASLAACAQYAGRGTVARTVLQVSARGAVENVLHRDQPLAACAGKTLKAARFGRGAARLFEVRHRFHWSGPEVAPSFQGPDSPPSALSEYIQALAFEARACLPASTRAGRVPGEVFVWSVDDAGRVQLRTIAEPNRRARLPAKVTRCLLNIFGKGSGKTLKVLGGGDEAEPRAGILRMNVSPAPSTRKGQQRPTTYLGYELRVEASADDEKLGATKVRLRPGSIPDLRLRASKVVAAAGDTVQVKVLRGPNFSRELPDKLVMTHEGNRMEAELDPETRTARFTLFKDRSGWYTVRLFSARTLIFVPDERTLEVAVATDKPAYPPGATATLTVTTRLAGQPVPAMVGLFGVDETLGQLAALPGPDAWTQLLTLPTMSAKAFEAIDAVALVSGRVQGAAALAATVLKVSYAPSPAELDRPISRSVDERFDPGVPLTDAFYSLLTRLMDRVRAWDAKMPKKVKMTSKQMAELWAEVLDEAPEAITQDAFGRRLTLDLLPDDLLALVDPRAVVTNGTRLPEDVDNWIRWVRRNR